MVNKMEIGIPSEHPLRDCYDIGGDICRMVCVSSSPCNDLVYLIRLCGTLYSQYKTHEENEIGNILLKTENQERG